MSLIDNIFEAGVVGAGGAGFPTHIKYASPAEHLIINAAECEPLLFTDQYQMINNADDIIDAIVAVKEMLQSDKTTIVIKEEFTKSIDALENSINKKNAKIDFKKVETFYPAGDEHSAIYEATGEPLGPGKLPIEMGLVVSNVATMKNIADSMKNKPVTRKIVTLSGEINQPKIIDVPIGITVAECIDIAGGTPLTDYHILLGGPMMGKLITKEEAETTVITKTVGGILIFDSGHPLITRRLQSVEKIRNQTASACISCTFCTELCPRYLKGHPLHPHEVMRAFGQNDPTNEMLKQADLCCSCGICEMYSCPMGLSPRMVMDYVKAENREHQPQKVDWQLEGVRDTEALRKLPTARLNMKIGIDGYAERNFEDFEFEKVERNKVSIPISQHIGKPADPIVKVGDNVKAGDLIAKVTKDDVGANIHASIDGTIKSVTDSIIIEGGTI